VFASQLLSFSESKELLYSSELCDTALLHGIGVIAFNFFLCRYLFISSAFFNSHEENRTNEDNISRTSILKWKQVIMNGTQCPEENLY
jgi:hypothetical protein